jgi:hypothetical protein
MYEAVATCYQNKGSRNGSGSGWQLGDWCKGFKRFLRQPAAQCAHKCTTESEPKVLRCCKYRCKGPPPGLKVAKYGS